MAYHLSAKVISRGAGRSTTGAAAYRAGELIVDQRTGLVHDYSRKGGVLHAEMVLPGGGTADRGEFWNSVEAHHKRRDAVLARELEVSLPKELNDDQRQALAVAYARELADRYGVAVDVALHAPRQITDKQLADNPDTPHQVDPATGKKHNGNWHAHIMLSACYVQPDGTLGKKCVELDPIHCQRAKIANAVDFERGRWAELTNAALERAGVEKRVDHRSLADQGIGRAPSRHIGPSAAGYERRTGEPSRRRLDIEADQQAALERLQVAQQLGEELRATYSGLARSALDLRSLEREREQLIQRSMAAREALYERYRAGPDGQREIELAGAYGMRYDPRTAAEAESLQRQVDSRMRRLDEIEAEARRAAEAPKPTLADLTQQPQRAPEPQPAPVPKVDTPKPQGSDLGALLAAGSRVAGPSEPLPSPSGGFPGARRSRVPEADAYTKSRSSAEPVRWHEYESDGERYRRDAERAQDARRVEWLHDGTGEWHSQPHAVIDQHAGRQPEPEQQAQEQKPRDPGRSM